MPTLSTAQTPTPQVDAPQAAAPTSAGTAPPSNADLNTWLTHATATGDGFTQSVIERWFGMVDATEGAIEGAHRIQRAAQEAEPTFLDGAMHEIAAAEPGIRAFRSILPDLRGSMNSKNPERAEAAKAVYTQIGKTGGLLLPFWLQAVVDARVTDVAGLTLTPAIPHPPLVIDNLAPGASVPSPRDLPGWAEDMNTALDAPIRAAHWAIRTLPKAGAEDAHTETKELMQGAPGVADLVYEGQQQFVSTHAQLAGVPVEALWAFDKRAEPFSEILLAAARGEDAMALAPEGEAPDWYPGETTMTELFDGLTGLEDSAARLTTALDKGDVGAATAVLTVQLPTAFRNLNGVRGQALRILPHWDARDPQYRWADLARTAFEPYRAWSHELSLALPRAAQLVSAQGNLLESPGRRVAFTMDPRARALGLHLPDGLPWLSERSDELLPAVRSAAALETVGPKFAAVAEADKEEREHDPSRQWDTEEERAAEVRRAQVAELPGLLGWDEIAGVQRLYVSAQAVGRGLPNPAVVFLQKEAEEANDQVLSAWVIPTEDFATLDGIVRDLDRISLVSGDDDRMLAKFDDVLALAQAQAADHPLTVTEVEDQYLGYVFRRLESMGKADQLFGALQFDDFHTVNRYWTRTGRFARKDTLDTVVDSVVGGQEDLWGQGESTGERLTNGASTLGRNFGAASLGVGWGVVQSVPVLGSLADGAFHEDIDAMVVELMMPGASQEDHDQLLPMVRAMNTAGALYGTSLGMRLGGPGSSAFGQGAALAHKGLSAGQGITEAVTGEKLSNLTAPSADEATDPRVKARRKAYEKGGKLSTGQRILSGILGAGDALGTAKAAKDLKMFDASGLDELTGVTNSLDTATEAVGAVGSAAVVGDEAVKQVEGKGSGGGLGTAGLKMKDLRGQVSNLRGPR